MSGVIMAWGKVYMWRRRPVAMRPLVACWNGLWGCLNLVGFLRLAPLVVSNAQHYSLQTNVCGQASSLWTSGTTGLWGTLWIYFKMAEVIIESFLVVLLKQPCGLLQWFNNYAYTLLHGYHLVTSQVPGGSVVLNVYYGIVAFMNIYCFYLNWNHLALPQQPDGRNTMVLDGIHLLQTLSGVALSVVTLHYWKQAVWNHHEECHANEAHIRILAFFWSGGHVLVWLINAFGEYLVARAVRAQQKAQKEQQRQRRRHRHSLNSKTVTFATTNNGKGRTKKQVMVETGEAAKSNYKQSNTAKTRTNTNRKIPQKHDVRSSPPPAIVEEMDLSNRSLGSGTHKVKKRNKKMKKNNKQSPQEQQLKDETASSINDSTSNTDNNDSTTSTDGWATTDSKKKKKRNSTSGQRQLNNVDEHPDGQGGKHKSE